MYDKQLAIIICIRKAANIRWAVCRHQLKCV